MNLDLILAAFENELEKIAGLPRAVRKGGGGRVGALMREKNRAGRDAAKQWSRHQGKWPSRAGEAAMEAEAKGSHTATTLRGELRQASPQREDGWRSFAAKHPESSESLKRFLRDSEKIAGLPRSIRAKGGGGVGRLMRSKNSKGRSAQRFFKIGKDPDEHAAWDLGGELADEGRQDKSRLTSLLRLKKLNRKE